MSKIQFWKQFTTPYTVVDGFHRLYSICQRYNFESNLQQSMWFCTLKFRCIRYVKDTILKAIYNSCIYLAKFINAVFDMSKIQFWKQFTTYGSDNSCVWSCIRYVKDTILKAIYNQYFFHALKKNAVFDMSKIQFWKQFTTGKSVK